MSSSTMSSRSRLPNSPRPAQPRESRPGTWRRARRSPSRWCESSGAALLAIDRIGQQPLFHTTVGGTLVFSTTADGLRGHPDVRLAVSPPGIYDNLYCHMLPSPASVYAEGAPHAPVYVYDSGLPVLGICYGMQALTQALGGRVAPSQEREYGLATLDTSIANPLVPPGSQPVWMSHGDRIERPPQGFSPWRAA